MGARNRVIDGAFAGSPVSHLLGEVSAGYPVSKGYVSDYEILDESKRVSATSAVTRGALGVFLLGPIGAAAALSAKQKGTYLIAIQWSDGRKSLLEVDEKIKKAIAIKLF